FVNHGVWKLTANGTATTLNIGRIVFTSRVGLPNVAGNLATTSMFRLYNVSTGQVIASQASAVDNVAGTVTFDGIIGTQLQLTRGVSQMIALQVTTTSTAVWPINTQLQWSITSAANVSVGSYGTATDLAAATDTDFGTAILLPTHANTTGGILKTGVAGAAFVMGTDQLYLVGVAGNATGVVTAGDTLLIPNTADKAAGRYAGRVMVAADPDVVAGTPIVVPTLAITNPGAVGKTGAAAAAGVYGTDGFYIKGAGASAATIEVGDIRGLGGSTITSGKDYSGAVGYGATTWSIPADANTVTLP
ncbi:MAG: hypothetical protein M1586_00015, partial [Patescibacteria group bacterium]|nr:hypothetical protein [Patescibacteria group bacterium]